MMCYPYLLEMILQMDEVSGGQMGLGPGVGGTGQLLSLTFQWWAISGQDGSIFPLGNMQSSVLLLSHVPVRYERPYLKDLNMNIVRDHVLTNE